MLFMAARLRRSYGGTFLNAFYAGALPFAFFRVGRLKYAYESGTAYRHARLFPGFFVVLGACLLGGKSGICAVNG